MNANAFSAGFQRIVHRFWPVPVGSSDRVTKYRHLRTACSVALLFPGIYAEETVVYDLIARALAGPFGR